MPLAAVWPELPNVHVWVACAGAMTGELAEQAVKVNCGAVFTTRLKPAEAELPETGHATILPGKVPMIPVFVVTVTLPQLAVFAAQLVGPPLTLVVESVELYWMPVATVWPLLPTTQVWLADAGATAGELAAQDVNVSAAGLYTVRLKPTAAAAPAAGVAVRLPA